MSDYFFYDINKKMADLASQQQLTEDAQAASTKSANSQLNERDLGKHNNATTGFAALAKKTGGGEKGARIAGAQLAKMRAKGQVKEGSKPDFLDLDKDGDRKEPMKSAARGAKKEVDEAAKWRQGYSASGHPAGYKHKSGEVGPVGGTFTNEPSGYDGDTKKVPVQKYRDKEDELAGRANTKLSTTGKPLLPKNAQQYLKRAIKQSLGKHGPVGMLPEQGVAEGSGNKFKKQAKVVSNKLYNQAYEYVANLGKWQNKDFDESFDKQVEQVWGKLVDKFIATNPEYKNYFYPTQTEQGVTEGSGNKFKKQAKVVSNKLYNQAYEYVANLGKWQNKDFDESFDKQVEQVWGKLVDKFIATNPEYKNYFYPTQTEQGVTEGAKSHSELARLAHEAYIQAVRSGNSLMANHYKQAYEKHKRLAASERKSVTKGVTEGETTQTSTGRIHKGTYGTSYDDDYKAPPTQRGRGRPRLGADSTTGEVIKPDWSAFSKKVSPKTKLPTTRHKMVGEAPNAMPPMDLDGSTAPPAKGPDGQYPIVTSGPNKGKRWSPNTPGPTNPTMKEGGIPMTPKQQKFAKLAPPVDKITFADKIVGAKKEVDEMLGDVAAMAMKKAVRGRNRDMEEGFMDDDPYSRKSSTGGRIDTSRAGVTRHHAGKSYSGAGHDAGADDAPSGAAGRRRVGAGMGKKIGAKINTGKSKLMTREDDMDPADQGEYDQEGAMAKDDIKTVVRHAQALEKILGDNDNLPEWVQAKLAKIEGMMTAVDDYMQNQQGDNDSEEIEEKAVSQKQQKFMGMAHAMQKGEKIKGASPELKKVAKTMKKGDVKDFASTKREGLPVKAEPKKTGSARTEPKKKEVDETTTSGSVAASSAAPKSGGGTSYGKGIYDSLDLQVEKMIAESMSINMSMNNDSHGGPSNTLTVTATDEDALQLAMLLKSAGLGSQDHDDMSAIHDMEHDMSAIHDMDHDHGNEPCSACGSTDCECDEVHEAYGDTTATNNEPDWPTDQEGSGDAMMYSGGLDGPKSTGQTTVPVIAGQDDRMGYNGDHELRRMMEIAGFSK